jgi:hypothetical protein
VTTGKRLISLLLVGLAHSGDSMVLPYSTHESQCSNYNMLRRIVQGIFAFLYRIRNMLSVIQRIFSDPSEGMISAGFHSPVVSGAW